MHNEFGQVLFPGLRQGKDSLACPPSNSVVFPDFSFSFLPMKSKKEEKKKKKKRLCPEGIDTDAYI